MMLKKKTLFAAAAILLIGGCADDGRSVEYFENHIGEAKQKSQECKEQSLPATDAECHAAHEALKRAKNDATETPKLRLD